MHTMYMEFPRKFYSQPKIFMHLLHYIVYHIYLKSQDIVGAGAYTSYNVGPSLQSRHTFCLWLAPPFFQTKQKTMLASHSLDT
jgi:hypothetical protein